MIHLRIAVKRHLVLSDFYINLAEVMSAILRYHLSHMVRECLHYTQLISFSSNMTIHSNLLDLNIRVVIFEELIVDFGYFLKMNNILSIRKYLEQVFESIFGVILCTLDTVEGSKNVF